MKEVNFIRRHIDKWRNMEIAVDNAENMTPDELAEAYTELTADLAFAQTHYPTSRITLYLNNLAGALHNEIYSNKREKRSRIITYWTHEVPQTMWEARKLLLVSLIIFVVSALIGVVSTIGDPEFPRLILGDGYVDMTLDNIAKGEPMGVYGNEGETGMFLSITLNNIMVSFRCFVMGLFTSVGSGLMLFYNGIMVGAFQEFFHQHSLLWESSLAIWLHGTIEISSIIVAGAAGISLGNGFLFPGTYKRMVSFRRGAVRGMKIVVGTVPLFIIAGFIESFITRHTEIYDSVRLLIILLSLAFIIFYFVWWPWWLYGRRSKHDTDTNNNEKESLI
ncbi:MAG: stage II sporulation protein M [Prevotella sp.]|nr:stage II sporulation protein M [Prevotella sp.]